MKSVVVGTAGHIDHGKSALVRALTGIDPDRLKEEKTRGITIDLGFAHLTIGDITFAFVDVPGHERFVKNMLAGVGGIDLVVLVVAANESVMPQTREHFEICRLLRVPAGLVAVTKADLVDEETVGSHAHGDRRADCGIGAGERAGGSGIFADGAKDSTTFARRWFTRRREYEAGPLTENAIADRSSVFGEGLRDGRHRHSCFGPCAS